MKIWWILLASLHFICIQAIPVNHDIALKDPPAKPSTVPTVQKNSASKNVPLKKKRDPLASFYELQPLLNMKGNIPLHTTVLYSKDNAKKFKFFIQQTDKTPGKFKQLCKTKNQAELTPFMFATLQGFVDIMWLMAETQLDLVKMVDVHHRTPLHMAVSKRHQQAVAMLVKLYPEALQLKDVYGYSPMDIARLNGDVCIEEYLASRLKMSAYQIKKSVSWGSSEVHTIPNNDQIKARQQYQHVGSIFGGSDSDSDSDNEEPITSKKSKKCIIM